MYVSINREALVFCHKHPEHAVVNGLVTIELSHVPVSVIPLGVRSFDDFTDMEIRLLHAHTTGKKIESFSLPHLVSELLNVALALPESDVNPFEVKYQASGISKTDKSFYKYVKGAYSPNKVEDLFIPPPLDVTTHVPVKPVTKAAPPTPVNTPPRHQNAPHAPQFTQPLPTWHPLYKAAQAQGNKV